MNLIKFSSRKGNLRASQGPNARIERHGDQCLRVTAFGRHGLAFHVILDSLLFETKIQERKNHSPTPDQDLTSHRTWAWNSIGYEENACRRFQWHRIEKQVSLKWSRWNKNAECTSWSFDSCEKEGKSSNTGHNINFGVVYNWNVMCDLRALFSVWSIPVRSTSRNDHITHTTTKPSESTEWSFHSFVFRMLTSVRSGTLVKIVARYQQFFFPRKWVGLSGDRLGRGHNLVIDQTIINAQFPTSWPQSASHPIVT